MIKKQSTKTKHHKFSTISHEKIIQTGALAVRLPLDPEGRLLGVGQHLIRFNFINEILLKMTDTKKSKCNDALQYYERNPFKNEQTQKN